MPHICLDQCPPQAYCMMIESEHDGIRLICSHATRTRRLSPTANAHLIPGLWDGVPGTGSVDEGYLTLICHSALVLLHSSARPKRRGPLNSKSH